MINQSQFILLLKITVLAFIVGAIALPSLIEMVSPFWLLLFFIYWLIYSDSNGIYSSAFVLGILLDVFQGGILGQNALALVISSAFILSVKKSFFVSNLTTQQVYVFIASLIYLIVFLITHISVQGLQIQWLVLFVPFTGAILWPVVRFLLAKLKQ
ncbi:MAG: rod shape-determining protein MreD [Candidatus Pseudothioglobus sp.]|jgi:rod shape-determining protein MreD|nr:rod shape-determining protein MreD [Candidatus Thioglobus sp.]|tara:strand:- start:105 stop:572 length:468 start_codon:yes stop_codon:yes gene_type:complete